MRWNDDIYNVPAYSVADSARYLSIPTPTLNAWLRGRFYTTKKGQQAFAPLIQRPDPTLPQLSFTNLVEAHVLKILRKVHNVKLSKVRSALDYMSHKLDTSHPLVTKRFQTDGVDLFVEQMDRLVNVSRSGQLVMRETLQRLLTRVEWDADGFAVRFFPNTLIEDIDLASDPKSDKIIFLDPSIRFGKPIIAATGVPTDIIAELYNAGDSIDDIAKEYDCTPLQIKAAIRFEFQNRAA